PPTTLVSLLRTVGAEDLGWEETMSVTRDRNVESVARWSVGGVFLEALANRDYQLMATTLGPAVRFRAMLPPGPMDWEGPDEVAGVVGSRFGEASDYGLIDATVGE